jgi:hypothetical protein
MEEVIYFFFTCKKCGKDNRQSKNMDKATDGLCKKCRNIKIDENQLSLI